MSSELKADDDYAVWWDTGRTNERGENVARVIAISPYRGKYPKFFNAVLTLSAQNTEFSVLEMAVKLENTAR